MPISHATTPITDDDDSIRAALEDATIAALLPAVALITGDIDLARLELRPDPSNIFDPQGGLSPLQLSDARKLALEALIQFRDGGSTAAPRPSDADLQRLMAFVVGDENVGPYFELLREELALGGEDRRAPQWRKQDVAPGTELRVGIVGAGMSGILAAHRLAQAGVPFVIFEKNDDVGGTWFENNYPGCRVDVPNHLYSYSCAQEEWPQHFSDQATLLDYFRACADEFGVREHIRFGTEVTTAEFDERSCTWRLHVRGRDGEETVEVHALVSAVGQLNRPKLPEVEGLGTFAGPAFHSAQWDRTADLRGKRVAVIGTGASAAQLIPEVAHDAAELYVFQRTPNWFVPTPEYHDAVPAGMQWLLDHVPSYGQWYRLSLFWRMHEGLLPAACVDPAWDGEGRSVSAANDMVRELLTAYLRAEFAVDPELGERVIPTYPPIAKRVIRDNGVWAKTLLSDHVHLVTDPIERVTPTGIVTATGEHEVDVIVYGTGFHASKFLTPMRVVGRGGVDLHEQWSGDARAHLGITVPGFPNLFCLYGPNTNIVINGSIIYFTECEVRYLVESVRMLLEGGHRAMDCRPEVYDAFNDRVEAANRQMAWGASTVNSWYKNEHGRVTQNWPFTLLEYWEQTRVPDAADYELL